MTLKIKIIDDCTCQRCGAGNITVAYIREAARRYVLENCICLPCLAKVDAITAKARKALEKAAEAAELNVIANARKGMPSVAVNLEDL